MSNVSAYVSTTSQPDHDKQQVTHMDFFTVFLNVKFKIIKLNFYDVIFMLICAWLNI